MVPELASRAGFVSDLFDALERRWESHAAHRLVADGLVAVFLVTLLFIELGRRGLLPAALAPAVPQSHFHAVQVAFYLLLGYEVVGLVFGLARSVANAAGKQFEIFSLILLRQSFETFGHLDEPLVWSEVRLAVPEMLANGAGALVIFVLLGFYYRLQRHQPLSPDARDRQSFIAAKKAIALVLLVLFVGGAAWTLGGQLTQGHVAPPFFEALYTLLIFADILVVLRPGWSGPRRRAPRATDGGAHGEPHCTSRGRSLSEVKLRSEVAVWAPSSDRRSSAITPASSHSPLVTSVRSSAMWASRFWCSWRCEGSDAYDAASMSSSSPAKWAAL